MLPQQHLPPLAPQSLRPCPCCLSPQVGQVILNLPNSMAKAGLPLGTFFQLWAALVSLYTLWLLSHLYQEFKRRAVSAQC